MSRVAVQTRQDRAQLGIAMMLVAYLFFAMIDSSVKWLVIAGIPAIQLAFMRYVGHFVISTAIVLRGGADLERFKTARPGLVVFRAYLLLSSTVLNFVALQYLPLTITSAIMFSSPLIVCALSQLVLGEEVGPRRWAAIIAGFIGVLVVIQPFGVTFHWAMLLTVHNAIAFALYSLITRTLSGIVAAETMQFYMGALGTLVLLPFAIYTWQTPENLLDICLLIGLGIWGWAGHELLTRAHGFATANTLMPFTYSFMLYLTVASYLFFDHIPKSSTILGAIIIVAAGLYIWLRERAIAAKRMS